MPSRPDFDHMQSRLVLIFLVLAIFIGLAGYLYFDLQKQHVKENIEDELSAIADLKTGQIAAWRKERLEDAMSIVKNTVIASAVQRFLQNPALPDAERAVLHWMNALREISDYRSILLVDPDGRARLSTGGDQKVIGSHARQLIAEVMRTRKPALSDFHRGPGVNFIHLDLAVPLLAELGNDHASIGVALIRINPDGFLYPLIQSWPGTSRSAETLLFRKDADSVIFLNELRHRKDTALSLRIQIANKRLPAVKAMQGESGVFEGIDYREVPVLAAMRSIPQTAWFLVAKVDIEEIFAPIRDIARLMAIVVIVMIAAAGLSIIFWWRQKTAEYARMQYEAEIKRENVSRQYDYLIKYVNDIILLIDPEGHIVEANDRAAAAYGRSREELLRLNIRDIRSPETRDEISDQMMQVRKHNGLIFETLHVRKDGASFPVEVSSRIIDIDGKSFFQSIIRDISERKQAETTLRERNIFIETILSSLPIGLAVNTIQDGKAVYMNAKFEEIYGWPKDFLADVEKFFTHVYPDPVYRKEIRGKILSDIASGDPSRMRWDNVPITTQTGETRFIAAVDIPLFEQGLMISTVLDVTARRHAEQALAESEKRFKRLVESVTDYIYTVEVEGRRPLKTIHGPGCVNVTGYTQEDYGADPDLWLRMIFEGDRPAVLNQASKVLSGTPVAPFEHRIIHKDGSLRWVRNTPVPRFDQTGRLIAYDGLVTDITRLKLLENQLRQAQKMEAVGQLAGGIAHDFNNILTAIIGYANLLMMKLPANDPGRAYVDPILTSAERAAHLTSNLLAFSRKQIINLKPVSVNDIIRRVEKLLVRVIGEDIAFRTRLSSDDHTVLADSIQIEHVLMNLATNSRDAMPDGGTLTIETDAYELGEEFVRAHSYGKPGRYVLISVTDTGVGMDENVRARIFEPFFTTKEVGKGTGLGLSMVYGIIKQHSGYINISSEPGKGATFTIYLPLITAAAAQDRSNKAAEIKRGTETVLLAEDDTSVRELTRNVLEGSGYTVIEAADGADAVRKFAGNKDVVDILVFDIIMPMKNGKEAYLEINAVRPGIKVLFTSGYTADIIQKKGILETGLDFVLKPITPMDFLKKVREVLDKK